MSDRFIWVGGNLVDRFAEPIARVLPEEQSDDARRSAQTWCDNLARNDAAAAYERKMRGD